MALASDIPAESVRSASVAGSIYSYAVDERGCAHILRCITHERDIRVPDHLDGFPVTAIAHAAFAALDATESIFLAPAITQIGWNAFADCRRLMRIVMPAALDHTDETWFIGCVHLADAVLPARAERIDAGFLKTLPLVRMTIGSGTSQIDIPPFWSSHLREVAVDEANPYLSTDGRCLYARDGSRLIKCLVEEPEYTVIPGCRIIGESAFAFNGSIARINLPDTIEEIGERAFLGSGLERFDAPPRLRRIGDRAFARCASLQRVELNDALEDIGAAPFIDCSALERLCLPASVRSVGRGLAEQTPLEARGPAPTLSIDPHNTHLLIENGVLYRRSAEGLVAIDALDPQIESCRLHPGTSSIGDNAFADCTALRRVELPAGLREIGAEAFAGCERLSAIELPAGLRSIGTRALFNAALEELRIPAALEHLGSCALAVDGTDGRVPARRTPTLRDVQIDPANERFFLESGILCERISGYARAVLYVGPQDDVAIPRNVAEIGPYAFAGVTGLARLALHDGIERIGTLGLALADPPDRMEIAFADATTGADQVLRIHPIRNQYGLRALRNAFADGRIDAKMLADGMDRMALYSRDRFERVRYMVERLNDPCLLSASMRASYDRNLTRSIVELASAAAANEWHGGLDMLVEMGYLDAQNIDAVISAVNASGNVAACAYLIKLKHQRLQAGTDYSL